MDALIRVFPAGAAAARTSAAGPRPIFICGMFRSGSTLTERLLARGTRRWPPAASWTSCPQLVRRNLPPFPQSVLLVSDATLARLAAARYRAGAPPRVFPGRRWSPTSAPTTSSMSA